MARRAGAPRILTYGFFGMGNLGNEASLEAFLQHVRRDLPQARVSCLGTGPDAVRAQHHIPTRPLMLGRPGVRRSKAVRVLFRLVDIPRTWLLLGAADVVVVPGMGVLETSLGAANPLGLPYWLFVLALGSHLRRRPLLLLSVGADVPTNRLVRFFFARTVRLSSYTSFRDEASSESVRELLGGADPGPVYPDLAFGLPVPATAPGSPVVVPGRVVFGVMSFAIDDDPDALARYEEKVSAVIRTLAQRGDSVRLVIGAVADFPVADRIAEGALAGSTLTPDQVAVVRAETQSDVMAEMAHAEVVVGSRFHNVLGALQIGAPTVSLGYADKNADLLAEFGLGDYDQSISGFDPDVLLRQIAEMRDDPAGLERRLKVARSYRAALDEQYARIRPLLVR